MGIDRPDDSDLPSDEPADRSRGSGVQYETRSRQEYYDDLRATVAGEARAATQQMPAAEGAAESPRQAANGKPWDEVTDWSRRVWTEYQRKWPPEDRPPGTSREGDNRPVSQELEEVCDYIAEQEHNRISPAILETESRDPDRHLVGWEYRLKGRDRIQEKVFEGMEENGLTSKEALSLIPDAIRYTFQYDEARYTQGVWDDTERLEEKGFELVERRNSWTADQYKGINSRWIDPGSGQRFEIQFHTSISFEAKQITHSAYEQLRSGQADELEEMVLEAFQRKVSVEIPVPPGATNIPNYP